MFEVRNVAYGYNGKKILNNIDLTARAGTMVSIIGPNGSGKTTLLKCISGITRLWSGTVLLNGRQLFPPMGKKMPCHWGYMPQEIPFKGALTVLETVLLGRTPHLLWRAGKNDIAAVDRIMGDLGIMGLAHRNLGDLSGGERQRVFIAQTLVRGPKLLFLDEPTSNLDLRYQFEVLEIIRRITREMGIASIIVMHDLNLAARYSDQVMVLSAGEVFDQGPPEDVLTAKVIERVYRVRARVEIDSSGVPRINFLGLSEPNIQPR
jgi:iron complex transport system ATP-binding protein